jgi:hypothetical protein
VPGPARPRRELAFRGQPSHRPAIHTFIVVSLTHTKLPLKLVTSYAMSLVVTVAAA